MNMSNDSYQPIACADYDIYEIAIMQNRQLLLSWTSADSSYKKVTVKPLKLHIENGAEYLIVEVQGDNKIDGKQIRLDKIIYAEMS